MATILARFNTLKGVSMLSSSRATVDEWNTITVVKYSVLILIR